MSVLEIVEVVKTGEKQLDLIRRQINRIHAGTKILSRRKIEQLNSLMKAHKETAEEVAHLVNN